MMPPSNNTNYRRLSLFLGAVLLLVAPIASLLPSLTPPSQYHADKFIHAGYYCLLTFFCIYGTTNRDWPKPLAIAMTIFLYSILIEFMQQFIDARTASVTDIIANGLGVTLAFLINSAFLMHDTRTD